MGTYRIVVEGHGIHHNGRHGDANVLGAQFVEHLKQCGHDVSAATFQLTNTDGTPSGEPDTILDADAYLRQHATRPTPPGEPVPLSKPTPAAAAAVPPGPPASPR